MRRTLAAVCILFLGLTVAGAEPLFLEQAGNVNDPGVLEAGLGDISYQTDIAEFDDKSKLTVNTTLLSVYSRYAFSDKLEGALMIPYLSMSAKSEAGGASSTTDDSGLGDARAAFKYNFSGNGCWTVSAGLGLGLPTGKQSEKLPESFRNGINVKPVFAASKKLDKYALNLNLSYNITGEYEDAAAAKTKHNPGDVLSFGAGLEYPVKGDANLVGEFVYNSLSEASSGGTAVSGSSGSQMDLIVGARKNWGSLKGKLAVALSIGDEKYRAYDYKVIAGLTYLWKI